VGLLLSLLTLTACVPAAPKRDTAGLDTVVQTAVERKRVPGVVAMVAAGDAVAYERAFGLPRDAIFAIASMTQ
jgi:hypothetical protein